MTDSTTEPVRPGPETPESRAAWAKKNLHTDQIGSCAHCDFVRTIIGMLDSRGDTLQPFHATDGGNDA